MLRADDVLEEDERGAGCAAPARRASCDEARQHARHLDARELGAAAVAHAHREVHAEVRDVGERMAGIEGQRREDREDVRP